MRRKEKLFFEENNAKICEAISFEEEMVEPLPPQKTKKLESEQMQKRIICRTKLALLKSDLIKKFKEIKENYLE